MGGGGEEREETNRLCICVGLGWHKLLHLQFAGMWADLVAQVQGRQAAQNLLASLGRRLLDCRHVFIIVAVLARATYTKVDEVAGCIRLCLTFNPRYENNSVGMQTMLELLLLSFWPRALHVNRGCMGEQKANLRSEYLGT